MGDLEEARAVYFSDANLKEAYDEEAGLKNSSLSTQFRGCLGQVKFLLKKPDIKTLVDQAREMPNDLGEGALFGKGDWVEVRGNDLKWALARISDVQERQQNGWDKEAPENIGKSPPLTRFYYFGYGKERVGRDYDDFEIRTPREALENIFGKRPFVWQQYALIRLEAYLRLEEHHIYDFDDFDIYLTVRDWWREWLEHSENADFLEEVYRNEERYTQKLLFHHIMTPFKLMENIREDEEDWDFDDDSITVYTYLGILGDGTLMVTIVFFMQIIIPLILLYTSTVFGTEGSSRRGAGGNEFNRRFNPPNGTLFGSTTWDQFCDQGGSLQGKLLLAAVILIYLVQVIPDTLFAFYNVAGVGDSTFSKITSLRRIVYEQRKDHFFQIVGFQLDRWMNTAYISILYLIMLYILLMTENILDIILNALAIIFIHQIDENIANSPWWDADNRWITAGTLQLVIQSVVDKRVLGNAGRLCKAFDIDIEVYKETFDFKGSVFSNIPSLRDPQQAKRDEENRELKESKASRNVTTFDESVAHFGIIEKFMSRFGIYRNGGTFNKYEDYRVWSRWDDVVFMARLPDNLDDERLSNIKSKTPFADLNPFNTFIFNVAYKVGTFYYIFVDVYKSARTGDW
eukprot:CAMPEP_0204868342 /NCGR_PEP_ID=MMETSP1348-20121228/26187_1 /ASSEMBLY_ACC=CAM_ASM_000700 /TAXON_ID=215587 /ORGANISM="Aplanochytrium stocchinoi, Strain GSBS06" /LENGTH=628 /DNA_ID=CAMNT_0052021219 /DNA_START=177 /DNA_END=2060 /DNA_ORIENTATION=-